jgi:hypothetical protein
MEVPASIPPKTNFHKAQELPKSNTRQQKTSKRQPSRSRDNNSRKEEQRHSREEVREEPGPGDPISADWLGAPFMALEVATRKLQQTVTTTDTIQKDELLAVTTVKAAHQKKVKELNTTNEEDRRKQSRSKSYASLFASKKGKSALHASPKRDTVKEETQSQQQKIQEYHELQDIQASNYWLWSLFMSPEEEQGQPEETIVMIMDEEEDNNNSNTNTSSNNKNNSRKWGFRNKNSKISIVKNSNKTTQEVDKKHSEKKKNTQWKAKATKTPKLDERQDTFGIRNDGQRKHGTKKSSNNKRQKNETIILEESRDDDLVQETSWLWSLFMFPEEEQDQPKAKAKAKATKTPKLDERQDTFGIRNGGQRKHRTKKSSNKKRQKNETIILEESRDDDLVGDLGRRSRRTPPADGHTKLNSRPTRRSSNNMTRRSSSQRRHREIPEINILSYASSKGTGQEMLLLTETPKKKKNNEEHGKLVRSMI